LIAAGCLRPDEADLSRHDCYINRDGHRFTGLPETMTDGPKVTPLFAAMEPIALASIEVELVRVTVVCSVGINLTRGWNRRIDFLVEGSVLKRGSLDIEPIAVCC
jgi:hypothetical protein